MSSIFTANPNKPLLSWDDKQDEDHDLSHSILSKEAEDSDYLPMDRINFGNLCSEIVSRLKSGEGDFVTPLMFGRAITGQEVSEIIRLRKKYFSLRKIIEFKFCQITDKQAEDLATTSNLTSLKIGKSKITPRAIALLANSDNLVTLDFSSIEMMPEELGILARSKKIKKLSFYHCIERLDEENAVFFAKNSTIQILSFSRVKVSTRAIAALVLSTSLTQLSLYEGCFSESLFQSLWRDKSEIDKEEIKLGNAFAQNTHLTQLNLSQSDLGPKVASSLVQIPTLRYLSYSHNRLDREALMALASSNLVYLNIEECWGVEDEGAMILGRNQSLTALNMTKTGLGNKGVAALARLPALSSLLISYNKVDDEGVVILATQYSQLRALVLMSGFEESLKVGKRGVEALVANSNLTSLVLTIKSGEDEPFYRTTTLVSFFNSSKMTDDGGIMRKRTEKVRKVLRHWQSVCFLLAAYRANRENQIRDSVLSLVSEVMGFLAFPRHK